MIRIKDKTKGICSLIKSNKLTEEQLKEKIALDDKSFDKLINGELKVDTGLAFKLSYYLKTTINYWL